MKIVVLHGWGQGGEIWRGLTDKLGKSAVAIDMPGFGKEPLIKDDWGVPQYAKWVDDKISKYNEVILIGHSFGGRVAAEVASHNPKYMRGLVLSGAPCIYRPSLTTKIKIRLFRISKFLIPRSFRRFFYTGDLKRAGKLERIYRKTVNFDQTSQLKRINVPVLLIWGENDGDVPLRIAYEMSTLIDKSRLVIIDGAGHNAFLDQPNLFFGNLKKFIANLNL